MRHAGPAIRAGAGPFFYLLRGFAGWGGGVGAGPLLRRGGGLAGVYRKCISMSGVRFPLSPSFTASTYSVLPTLVVPMISWGHSGYGWPCRRNQMFASILDHRPFP